MNCPVCTSPMHDCFSAEVLGKYKAKYRACKTCGFLHATDPHWLKEAYTIAIANADTGIVMRNITLANKISRILYWLTNHSSHNRYLDVAGGYGLLTRMMRDNGFDFYWADKYCENLVAPGFEYSKSLGPCSAATAVEVLEHVTDPVAFIKDVIQFSGADTLIFTTELYEGEPPKPEDWWYYTLGTGQHISFFQLRTLEKLAKDLDFKFYTANGLHIFTRKPLTNLILKLLTNRYFSLFPPFLIRAILGSKTLIDYKKMINVIVDTETKID